MYAYEATSEEEISVAEDVQYDLFEDDGEWSLVGARDHKEVGYAPSAYLEVSARACACKQCLWDDLAMGRGWDGIVRLLAIS